jgi:spermidine/putrescine transport system substrate-binding protein
MSKVLPRLRWSAGMLLATALVLSACAPASDDTPPSVEGEPAAEPSDEGSGDVSGRLTIATWPNYHDPDVIERFTDETGVDVTVNVYGSTEEMEALLRGGSSGIDILMPTHYAVPAWIEDGLLAEIDHDRLGVDLSDWNPLFVDQGFDPGNRYSIPKNWGTTGIIYSPDTGDPVTSWTDFFDRADDNLAGRSVIVDHQISTIGSAAVALGYDLNTTDEGELAEIEELLTTLKPDLWAITSDVQPPLRNGDSWSSMAWTGDGVQVVRDNPEYVYVIPDDGGELWVDNWTIAADAPNPDAAYAFLEFILRPENSAADTDYCLFPHANPAVLALLDPDVANNPVIYPDQSAIERMTLSSADAYNSEARAEMWARVKASS